MLKFYVGSANKNYPAGTELDRPRGYPYYVLLQVKSPLKLLSDGQEYLVKKDQLILFEKYHPRIIKSAGEPFSIAFIHFLAQTAADDDFVRSLELPFNEPFDVLTPSIVQESIAQGVYEKTIGGKFSKPLLDSRMRWMLLKTAQMYIKEPSGPMTSPHYVKMQLVRSRIASNPGGRWKAAEIAKELNMSLSHFQHTFRELFDKSFVEDVINCRVRHAQTLLSRSSDTVERIGEECGYTDVFHFIKQFKSVTGITPGAYRRKYAQEKKDGRKNGFSYI